MIALANGKVLATKSLLNDANKTKSESDLINLDDREGRTALIYSIKSKYLSDKDRVEIVKLLLKNGADPKIASYKGKTALTYATAARNEEIVKILRNAEDIK